MDAGVTETKYQKLASEYSKLRAQASVLKKAVLEEQSKELNLRDQLRQRDTSLRRAEQEVDSLGFRNRQLESRVAALQQELVSYETRRKKDKELVKRTFGITKSEVVEDDRHAGDATRTESCVLCIELERKVMENAHLSSLIADKEKDELLYLERISTLENMIEKRISDHNEMEKRLRKDNELLQIKNSELETKLVEAASMLGSEDALSNTGSDNFPANINPSTVICNNAAHSSDDKTSFIEKDAGYWRAQFEDAKLHQTIACGSKQNEAENKEDAQHKNVNNDFNNLQIMYNVFMKKYEDLLYLKSVSDSRNSSFELEILNLQSCLEHLTMEVKAKDKQLSSLNHGLKMLEEDLATTRVNYEEQISVLTEQVISLSEQLASSK